MARGGNKGADARKKGGSKALVLGLHELPVDFSRAVERLLGTSPKAGQLQSHPRSGVVSSWYHWALFLSCSTLGRNSIRKSGIWRTWGWVGK